MIVSSVGIEAVHTILERIQSMFKFSANKILVAASALLLCAGFAQAQTPPASPLSGAWTGSPSPVAISYNSANTPAAGAAAQVTLSVHSGSVPFVVDATTVPLWLNTQDVAGNPVSGGTATSVAPFSLYLQASSAAGSLPAGVYSASVGLAVNGYQELVLPVSLTVAGASSTLSVMNGVTAVTSGGAAVPATWTYGSGTFPTVTLTLLSSNDPIEFTAVSAPTVASPENWIQLSSASGIAYNYGTSLTISFAHDALLNSKVSAVPMTGTVTITYGGTNFVVNLALTIQEPLPTVGNIFPQEIPAQATGSLTMVVTGSGFGTLAQGYTSATKVYLTYNGGAQGPTDLTTLTSTGGVHGAVKVVNPTTMILTIPSDDGTNAILGGNATIGVNNGLAGENTNVNTTLYVTTNPIIYSITDAGALKEPTPGSTPNVAPYELISIFGNNFCPTCANPVVAPVVSDRFPTSVTAGGSALTVTFYKAGGVTQVGSAYILFASNTQINALVPSTVVAADNPMVVVVSYGGVASNLNVASGYTVNAVLATPGIFTTSSSGQGQGAILNADLSVNSSTNKAAPGSTIVIYASGLGAPNSTAKDVAGVTTAAKFPGSCIAVSLAAPNVGYVQKAGLAGPATADGAILDPTDILTNLLPPCFATTGQITVTVGGLGATVTYAGWVSGSVTGLYQINATVPTKATAGNLPVVVTVTNSGVATSSQAGVTVAVN
jgi:uncharacterized protein (TIGR03437 family)